LRFVLIAVVLLLALMPSAALGALWWTGRLYDQLEWPTPPGINRDAPNETILLRVCGLARLNTDQNLRGEIAAWLTQEELADPGSTSQGDCMTMMLATDRDPEDLAKTIDWGSVRRVNGRVITVSVDREEKAARLARVKADLKSANPSRRKGALVRLRNLRPDRGDDTLARALEARLTEADPLVRKQFIAALAQCGNRESVTPLLKAFEQADTRDDVLDALRRLHADGMLPDERRAEVARSLEAHLNDAGFPRQAIMRTLGELKDEGSAEPLAQCLEKLNDGTDAAETLKAMGPVAEKAVVKRLQHPIWLVRVMACDVLKVIGTTESIPALKAVMDDTHNARATIRAITARQGIAREN
jgi:HEAT repeat protein